MGTHGGLRFQSLHLYISLGRPGRVSVSRRKWILQFCLWACMLTETILEGNVNGMWISPWALCYSNVCSKRWKCVHLQVLSGAAQAFPLSRTQGQSSSLSSMCKPHPKFKAEDSQVCFLLKRVAWSSVETESESCPYFYDFSLIFYNCLIFTQSDSNLSLWSLSKVFHRNDGSLF